MPAIKKYDAVATIGEYKDRNGETKKRYVNVGTVFENDKGQLSLKLDAVPCAQEWTGWISFFEPKERDQHNQRGGRDVPASEARMRSQPPARQLSPQDDDEESDSIPF